jgi:hypothetical protein
MAYLDYDDTDFFVFYAAKNAVITNAIAPQSG